LEALKANKEFYDMFGWFTEYGYYNGEDVSDVKQIYPQIKSFEDWLRATGWQK
jgi:hypothetical protein